VIMNIDQATIDAVNSVMAGTGIVVFGRYGEIETPKLDADDVSALILALAKCEPVAGLVEAGRLLVAQADVETGDRGPNALIGLRIQQARAALAPFTEGGTP
jgi:hypothetical protein